MCEKYWLLSENNRFAFTVKEIAAQHKIELHNVSKHVEQHCYVWFPMIFCGKCRKPYRFRTRSQYLTRNLYKDSVCSGCIKAENLAVENAKIDFLANIWELAEPLQVDLSDLSVKSKVYLLAVIQALADEGFSKIEPLIDYPTCTLSPSVDFDLEIINYLVEHGFLVISSCTPLEAIGYQSNQVIIDLYKSVFEITLKSTQVKKLHDEFSDVTTVFNIKQCKEFVELCKVIQLNECLSFLKNRLEEHKLSLVPGEKTKQVLEACLERFSVAQVYNFIWRAVTSAAAYYMRSSVSKRQAANSVVGAISRCMEKSIVNKWEVKPFKRNYNLPQSVLSRIVFDTILGTDDGGFNQVLDGIIEL